MKPILKWAGGKAAILPQLAPYIPEDFDFYVEPFCGGAAMFWDLREKRGQEFFAVLNDLNFKLINFYQQLRSHPVEIEALIRRMEFDKESYLKVRCNFNIHQHSLDMYQAGRFLYLNKTCFNGLYRENSKGEFNVPYGGDRGFKRGDTFCEDFLIYSDALENTFLSSLSYDEVFAVSKNGPEKTFIYYDPPYDAVFDKYQPNGFSKADQIALRDHFKLKDSHGFKVMLSNANTEFIRELYKDFRQVEINAPRKISAKNSGRSDVKELLILGNNL